MATPASDPAKKVKAAKTVTVEKKQKANITSKIDAKMRPKGGQGPLGPLPPAPGGNVENIAKQAQNKKK